jgi:hypothetical protein
MAAIQNIWGSIRSSFGSVDTKRPRDPSQRSFPSRVMKFTWLLRQPPSPCTCAPCRRRRRRRWDRRQEAVGGRAGTCHLPPIATKEDYPGGESASTRETWHHRFGVHMYELSRYFILIYIVLKKQSVMSVSEPTCINPPCPSSFPPWPHSQTYGRLLGREPQGGAS